MGPLVGDGANEQVLLANCSERLLAPYVSAVAAGGTAEALQDAAVEAAAVLTASGVDENTAMMVCGQVMAGVARAISKGAHLHKAPEPVTPEPLTPATEPVSTASKAAITSSSAPTAEPTPAPTSKPRSKLPIIIAAAVVAVVLVALGAFFLLRPKGVAITFSGGAGATGEVEQIMGDPNGTITLPENAFVNEGHEFAGWHASNGDDELLAPGTEVSVEDADSYTAAWKIQMSFDGNGADAGSMEAVLADEYSDFTIPKCDFTRTGYLFAGWTTDKDDGFGFGALEPGDTYAVGAPTTFYATWVKGSPVIELSIKELDKPVTGNIDEWSAAVGNCGLVVSNDTDKPIKLEATFVYTPADGGEDYKTQDYTTCLGPKNKTLLCGMYAYDATKVTYSVTAEQAYDWSKPVAGHFSFEVDEMAPDHVTAVFTNTDADKIELEGLPCLLTDPEGNHFISMPSAIQTLSKGQEARIVYNDETLLNFHVHPNWPDCDRNYFLKAYVSTV